MAMRDLFLCDDYKEYLNLRLDDPAQNGGRGSRSRMAEAIGCQTAYVAQVLRGTAHFNLEQGELINDFLSHTDEQGSFFLLLIQYQRAGIAKLKNRFHRQMLDIRDARMALKNRLGVKQSLKERDQVLYYSSWHYSAIHAIVSIPGFQTVDKIAAALSLEPKIVAEALEFLLQSGLLKETRKASKTLLEVGNTRIHLGNDSPLISKHHINWRLQGIRSVEKRRPEDLHYSSVFSISRKDALRIREGLIEHIKSVKAVIKDSPEEELHSFSLDLFKVE